MFGIDEHALRIDERGIADFGDRQERMPHHVFGPESPSVSELLSKNREQVRDDDGPPLWRNPAEGIDASAGTWLCRIEPDEVVLAMPRHIAAYGFRKITVRIDEQQAFPSLNELVTVRTKQRAFSHPCSAQHEHVPTG
jgi:hypothetical protein